MSAARGVGGPGTAESHRTTLTGHDSGTVSMMLAAAPPNTARRLHSSNVAPGTRIALRTVDACSSTHAIKRSMVLDLDGECLSRVLSIRATTYQSVLETDRAGASLTTCRGNRPKGSALTMQRACSG